MPTLISQKDTEILPRIREDMQHLIQAKVFHRHVMAPNRRYLANIVRNRP